MRSRVGIIASLVLGREGKRYSRVSAFAIYGHAASGFEAVAGRSPTTSRAAASCGAACCALPPRREGRRPVGRPSRLGEPSALGRRHDGRWSIRRPRGWQRWWWRSPIRAAGSTTRSASARYWPEFARNGKQRITVRQLLAHQAGLFALDAPVDRADRRRPRPARGRARAPEAGLGARQRQAYHALSLGFYQGELLRRVDPARRSLGQIFPGRDRHAPRPSTSTSASRSRSPTPRLAPLEPPKPLAMLLGMPLRVVLASHLIRARTSTARWSSTPAAPWPLDNERIYARNLEVPSGGGVGTARAIAQAYGAFAAGGGSSGCAPKRSRRSRRPAMPPRTGSTTNA